MSGEADQFHHERIQDPVFRRAVDLLDHGDGAGLRAHLAAHPDLVRQHVEFPGSNYFSDPALLEFVAENPVRRGTLPTNIVEIAETILDAGARENLSALNRTLELVASGRVARECLAQIPLIHLLCDSGADPNFAMNAALVHGEFEAARALLTRGVAMNLTITAGLGLLDEARRSLPSSSPAERQQALALAAQFGHAEIVQLLLDAGEDPSRYNPVGFHAHSTPLHQAALAGHREVVRLLVERGARTDLRDTRWDGTPADWAKYGGQDSRVC